MSLYFKINILSLLVPLLVSFHPKIRFYKQWNSLIPSIIIAAIPYIIWDIYFTEKVYWGFNSEYLQGLYLFGLPYEEWLFFICIPYSSIFIQFVFSTKTEFKLSPKTVNIISSIISVILVISSLLMYSKSYTIVVCIFSLSILLLTLFFNKKLLSTYYISFLIILIPFLVVNGILTGTGIDNEIVWYNNTENLNFRILTIPIEDFFYAFSMILLSLNINEFIRSKFFPNDSL